MPYVLMPYFVNCRVTTPLMDCFRIQRCIFKLEGIVEEQMKVDPKRHRYPYCVVWTPIPGITWIFPFIGHMGIATSRGVVRDFAGSYFVSEDEMGFGWPTRIWELVPEKVPGGEESYDRSVQYASEVYNERVHNLILDNCHSHVALALNEMKYDNRSDWNMVNLAVAMFFKGRTLGVGGFLKQWAPFFIFTILLILFVFFFLNRV